MPASTEFSHMSQNVFTWIGGSFLSHGGNHDCKQSKVCPPQNKNEKIDEKAQPNMVGKGNSLRCMAVFLQCVNASSGTSFLFCEEKGAHFCHVFTGIAKQIFPAFPWFWHADCSMVCFHHISESEAECLFLS